MDANSDADFNHGWGANELEQRMSRLRKLGMRDVGGGAEGVNEGTGDPFMISLGAFKLCWFEFGCTQLASAASISHQRREGIAELLNHLLSVFVHISACI